MTSRTALALALLMATPALADVRSEIEARAVCFRHEGADLPSPSGKAPLKAPVVNGCNAAAAKGEACAALDADVPAGLACLKRELVFWEGVLDTVTGPGFGEERRPGQRAAINGLVKAFRAYRASYCRGEKLIAVNPPEAPSRETACTVDLTIEFARDKLYPMVYSP